MNRKNKNDDFMAIFTKIHDEFNDKLAKEHAKPQSIERDRNIRYYEQIVIMHEYLIKTNKESFNKSISYKNTRI